MNSKPLLFTIILFIACLTAFASDVYAPAIPAISVALNTAVHHVQFSMAIYMAGVALTLLFYGILSEGFGRKPLLIIGLLVMLGGSFICMYANTISMLIFGRFIQGLGAGAGGGLWRAIFRDTFTGSDLAKYSSYLGVFIVFITPAAPTLGGYLLHYFGWHSSFIFISIYILLTIILISVVFKETHTELHPDKIKLSYIKNSTKLIFNSRVFVGITVCNFILYGAFFAWITIAPVLLIKQIGISPVYFGWLNFAGAFVAFFSGGMINGKFVSKFGIAKMLRFGWTISIGSGVLMLMAYFQFGLNLWAIFFPATLLYFGTAFIFPNAFAAALTPLGKIAGYAGAVYSFMQIAGAAVMGSIAAYLPHATQLPMAIIFLAAPLFSFLIFESVVRKQLMITQ